MFGAEVLTVMFLVGTVFAGAWVYQFVGLMLLSDADFPGRNDKALWVGVFVFFFVLAPVAFFFWTGTVAARNRRVALEQDPRRLNPS